MSRFFLILLLLPGFCFGQEKLPSFGKPNPEELMMQSYPADPGASALKLLDYQETELIIDYGMVKTRTERRVRIKIFDKGGYDQASITIPFTARKKTKINDISGYIYYTDSLGKIISEKIEKKQIFKGKAEEGVRKIAFAFPHVRPGCVVEYRYTKIEKNALDLSSWYFQDKIPTLLSICKVTAPRQLKIDRRAVGSEGKVEELLDKGRRDYNNNSYTVTYQEKNIPAFTVEPFMGSIKDNLHRMEFNLTPQTALFQIMMLGRSKWEVFTRVLLSSSFYGDLINKPITAAKPLVDSARKLKTEAEKIDYIFRETSNRLSWDESQTFYADDLETAWSEKSANSAEINLSLLNLLRQCGVRCFPILVSTREHGKPDADFPSLGQFNGLDVLAMDSSAVYILDGTQKYGSYNIPPLNILNRQVLLMDTANVRWVFVSDARPLYRTDLVIQAELEENGLVHGHAVASYFDHAKLARLTEKDEPDNQKDFIKGEEFDLKVDSLVEENAVNNGKPLINRFHFSYTLSNTNAFYFFDPFFLSSFRKNPFHDSVRHTEIDFGGNQLVSIVLYLHLPANFSIDQLPRSTLLRMPDTSLSFKVIYEKEQNILMFRNEFLVNQGNFDKEDYRSIREFFDKIYGMTSQKIMLKKNTKPDRGSSK